MTIRIWNWNISISQRHIDIYWFWKLSCINPILQITEDCLLYSFEVIKYNDQTKIFTTLFHFWPRVTINNTNSALTSNRPESFISCRTHSFRVLCSNQRWRKTKKMEFIWYDHMTLWNSFRMYILRVHLVSFKLLMKIQLSTLILLKQPQKFFQLDTASQRLKVGTINSVETSLNLQFRSNNKNFKFLSTRRRWTKILKCKKNPSISANAKSWRESS